MILGTRRKRTHPTRKALKSKKNAGESEGDFGHHGRCLSQASGQLRKCTDSVGGLAVPSADPPGV